MKVHEFVNEQNWCQRALCKDVAGNSWNWPYSSKLAQWCLTGIILYCYREDKSQHDILYKVKQHLIQTDRESDGHIARWNDRPERTWEQVRDLAQELDI